MILEAESFEGPGSEATWSSGATYYEQGFSQFLGRFGLGSEEMSKSFYVPRDLGPDKLMADQVQIEFALYQIDNWTATDQFFVGINGVIFNLGEMDATSISVDLSDEVADIKWERQTIAQGSDRGFGSQNDKKHLVKIIIPASVFPDEKIRLGFRAVTTQPIESESAGVDDLVIAAYYDCAKAPSSPSVATAVPTIVPTAVPMSATSVPTAVPTDAPTGALKIVTTAVPTTAPTDVPTAVPTTAPTDVPTAVPTTAPTDVPTAAPTIAPTDAPTAAPTSAPTSVPTASPTTADPTMAPTLACMPEVILESENFEVSGSEAAWSSGSTSNAPGFSQFLGRLGIGKEEMTKSFSVPPGLGPEQMEADMVSIEFSVYQIDDWTPTDQFLVKINGIVIDIGEMSSTSTSVDLSGDVSGIKWERQTFFQGSNEGFGSQNDKKHLVKLIVPASAFPNDTIFLGFRAFTSQDIQTESAGVDDLITIAYYDCAKEPSSSPSVAPSLTPSSSPSLSPSMAPTSQPSINPTTRAPVASTLSPGMCLVYAAAAASSLCACQK